MKTALMIAVPLGVVATAFMWRLSQLLSPDAIALALGLGLGVFAGVPSMALVAIARRRDEEDDWQPTIIDYPAPPTVYADEVTPYTHLARRVAGMPALPSRAQQIADLRAALDNIEAGVVR